MNCPTCGNEMNNDFGGIFYCETCDYSITQDAIDYFVIKFNKRHMMTCPNIKCQTSDIIQYFKNIVEHPYCGHCNSKMVELQYKTTETK